MSDKNVTSLQPKQMEKDAKRMARIIQSKSFNERGELFLQVALQFDSMGEVAMSDLFGKIALTYKKRHDFSDGTKPIA